MPTLTPRLSRYAPWCLLTALWLPVGAAVAQPDAPLFTDPPRQEGGWEGLARALDALTPSVDTRLPLTPSQVTDRIATMLDAGQAAEALNIIERRQAQRDAQEALGEDVQLMYLRGRALAQLGRNQEAIALYRDMTSRFPELPEPWNSLAALYVPLGELDLARDALEMALVSQPRYGPALANLGKVQLLLAERSLRQAAELGVSGAADQAGAIRRMAR